MVTGQKCHCGADVNGRRKTCSKQCLAALSHKNMNANFVRGFARDRTRKWVDTTDPGLAHAAFDGMYGWSEGIEAW